MEYLKAFILNDVSHPISVRLENDEPYFLAASIGDVLDIKNIRRVTSTYDSEEKTLLPTQTEGGMQNSVYLTEIGLYRLLMRSDKPNARVFQKWVAQVLKEIREKGKYELNCKIVELQQEATQLNSIVEQLERESMKTKEQIALVKHETFLEAYKGPDRRVTYIGEIKKLDDEYSLIKVGSTQDLPRRSGDHDRNYDSFCLIQVFECVEHISFEKYLQSHKSVKPHVYTDEIANGFSSTHEVFRMNQLQLDQLLRIAKHNHHRFKRDLTEKERAKMEKLEVVTTTLQNKLNVLEQHISSQIVPSEVPALMNDDERLMFEAEREAFAGDARGDKVQRYSVDGKQLLKTYHGCWDAARDSSLDRPTPLNVKRAINNKSVYKGFRWAFLARHLPDDTVQDIGESVYVASQKSGLVAMLNLKQTEIVDVFPDMQTAAKDRMYQSISPISVAVSSGTPAGGHYFQMWYDCDELLKQQYLNKKVLPDIPIRYNSIVVEKIDSFTDQIIKKYSSVADVIRENRISRKTLFSMITSGREQNGVRYRTVHPNTA